jgi:RNA polymerase sigma factor (sigma-70 family)
MMTIDFIRFRLEYKYQIQAPNRDILENRLIHFLHQIYDTIIIEYFIIQYKNLLHKIAFSILKSFKNYSFLEKDEIYAYCFTGLLDSLQKFNINKGNKFITYAYVRIRGKAIDLIRKECKFYAKNFITDNPKKHKKDVCITDKEKIIKKEVDEIIKTFFPKVANILRDYLYDNKTYYALAKKYEMTNGKIKDIINKALEIIKIKLENKGYSNGS